MKYGYARVSTVYQANEGNSLEAQERALKDAGAEIVYSDAYTGTKIERPNFEILISNLKSGDMLIVTKLDRIARSVNQGLELIQKLLKKGVRINILNMGVYENDAPQAKLMLTIMLAYAEFERDMIIERTTEGKAIKKEKGLYKEGRPAFKPEEEKLKELHNRQKLKEITVNDICKKLGISRSTWYKYTSTLDE